MPYMDGGYLEQASFEVLKGLTLARIDQNDDEIIYETVDGRRFKQFHSQDCCESVTVEDVTGNLDDLIGHPLLMAEEVTSDENPPDAKKRDYQESFTWTFYKLATVKGYVTIRWYGESNGYYSESVDFVELPR